MSTEVERCVGIISMPVGLARWSKGHPVVRLGPRVMLVATLFLHLKLVLWWLSMWVVLVTPAVCLSIGQLKAENDRNVICGLSFRLWVIRVLWAVTRVRLLVLGYLRISALLTSMTCLWRRIVATLIVLLRGCMLKIRLTRVSIRGVPCAVFAINLLLRLRVSTSVVKMRWLWWISPVVLLWLMFRCRSWWHRKLRQLLKRVAPFEPIMVSLCIVLLRLVRVSPLVMLVLCLIISVRFTLLCR